MRQRATVRGRAIAVALGFWSTACGDADHTRDADVGSDAGADAAPIEPAIGCGAGCPEGTAYADVVVDGPEGASDAARLPAVNGVRGGGDNQGGSDVLSLGLVPAADDSAVLRWSGRRVTNGPGADFTVFENAFQIAGSSGRFMDPTVVEVSRDGQTWVAFPHDYRAPDESAYSNDPAHWGGFAGITPVRYHEADNPVDPFDPLAAGGDAFDLDALETDDPEGAAIRSEGFVFLRLAAAAARTNPDTGAPYPREPVSNGPDIDGVYARHLAVEAAEP